MTTACRFLPEGSTWAFARILIVPFPVLYISSRLSFMTIPPLGKSGPGMISIISLIVGFGLLFFIIKETAAPTSTRLCVGILVAMPTAIPEVPLTRRFGKRAGKQVGSSLSPS